MTDLIELAERCEQAAGPDRELDREIVKTAFELHERMWRPGPMPKFTASLDAAITLVPEGWMLGKLTQTPRGTYPEGVNDAPWGAQVYVPRAIKGRKWLAVGLGQTGPIALCAAALRARASRHTLAA